MSRAFGRILTAMTAKIAPYKHVVLIGVDGMGAYCKNADVKNINRIFEHGAVTYECSSVYRTVSAQCWGSMLMGVAPETHGLTNQKLINEENIDGCPTVFRIIHEAFPDSHSASFCCWNPINHGIVEDLPSLTREKVGDDAAAARVEEYIRERGVPALLFIQMNRIDASGHKYGYGTPDYLRDVEEADSYVGDVYSVYERAGVLSETLFIVTADHGGIEKTHGGGSPEEMNVFFGAAGHNVRNVTIERMCIQDIPAIIAYALGAPSPSHWASSVPPDMFEN